MPDEPKEAKEALTLTPKQVQAWLDYVSSLEQQDQELFKETNTFETWLRETKSTNNRQKNRNLIYLIAGLFCLGMLAISIGLRTSADRIADILINFGSGVLGTAVTFLYIRNWQTTENNVRQINHLLRASKRVSDAVKGLKQETEELKNKAKTFFQDIDEQNPQRQKFKDFLDQMDDYSAHWEQLVLTRGEVLEEAANFIDDIELGFFHQRRMNTLKEEMHAKADEYKKSLKSRKKKPDTDKSGS
jgi:uncharacterized protein YoxC